MDQVPSAIANRTSSAATLVPVVFYHLDFNQSAGSAQILSLPALSTNGLLNGVTLTGDLNGPEIQSRLSLAESLRQSTANTWKIPKKPAGWSVRSDETRWGSWQRDTEKAMSQASTAVLQSQPGMTVTKCLFVDRDEWNQLGRMDSTRGIVNVKKLT